MRSEIQSTTLDTAPAYWFLNALHILLANSESEGGSYSLIHLTAPPGFITPYHVHHTEDEALYVLDGELTAICDGKKIVLQAGAYLFLPREVPHGFRCSSEETAHVLVHAMPGGRVGFVAMMLEMSIPVERHALPQPTPPDLQKLKALCDKNKIDVLGPLPD
jgi:quercetin dioxygenase-like cupin family protein